MCWLVLCCLLGWLVLQAHLRHHQCCLSAPAAAATETQLALAALV
jgi:hypothetical protein